jgi:hypothetical protein
MTATTLPLLTTTLFTFCMAVIAFAGSVKGVGVASEAPGWFRVIDIPFLLLAAGALTLLCSTICCLNAQAWDYAAMSEDYLRLRRISTDEKYVDKCMTEHRAWHRRAVYAYRCGVIAGLLGFAGVAWFPSKLTAAAIALAAVVLVIQMAWEAIAARKHARLAARQGITRE